MYIQIVNFELDGISEDDYIAVCDELAPAFAAQPGLMSKIWLRGDGTYGGVYTWTDQAAADAFKETELFGGVAAHPNLRDVRSTEFHVLEGPTSVTRGQTAPLASTV